METPKSVRKLIEDWQQADSPPQRSFGWTLSKWQQRFPDISDDLEALPSRVDRETVSQACADAANSPRQAKRAFVVAMAWGFGRVGYGPWRTEKVLSSVPDSAERLQRVAETLQTKGAVEAYRLMANEDECRLKGLGPAFGTKFLCFCPQAPSGPRALILDSIVGGWLDHEADMLLEFDVWSTPTYDKYITALAEWADDLGVASTDIEEQIFTNGWKGPAYLNE